MIKVVFFASVREAMGTDHLELDASEIDTVQDVILRLARQGRGDEDRVLSREDLLVAVNQTMVGLSHPVATGDEVAIFPPVTGG
ncbi:MAG: molybdopterin converting factor subunit 1 [Pseudomonadales bacterium]